MVTFTPSVRTNQENRLPYAKEINYSSVGPDGRFECLYQRGE